MERSCDKHQKKECTLIKPNGKDFYICKNDCEKQVNVKVEQTKSVIIWGYVTDCMDKPVHDAFVTLVEYSKDRKKTICHTYTDRSGYYQFNLKKSCDGKYRVYVSQSCFDKNKCDDRDRDRDRDRDSDSRRYDDRDYDSAPYYTEEREEYTSPYQRVLGEYEQDDYDEYDNRHYSYRSKGYKPDTHVSYRCY